MNLLQYATTLMSSFNLENLWVMSSGGFRSVICTFLTSRFSVRVLTTAVGQLDGSCESHCCPFHHSADVESVVSSITTTTTSSSSSSSNSRISSSVEVEVVVVVVPAVELVGEQYYTIPYLSKRAAV